jgi:hypothetical protein
MAKLIAQYNAGLRASRRAGGDDDDDDGPSLAASDTTASAVSEPPERFGRRQQRRRESPPRTRSLSRAPNADDPHHKPLAPGTSVVEPGLLLMGPRGAYAGAALASDAGFEIPGRIERAGMVAEEAAERFDAFLERMKTAAVAGGADADDDAGYSDDEDEGKRPTVIGDALAARVEAPGGAAEGNEAIDR